MTRILIRSGKDPFTPVVAESTLEQDVYNTNVGNYLFAHSVHRSLMVPGVELVSNGTLSERRRATEETAARVNDEFDTFVIPLANAFRPEFVPRLERLTGLIEHLTIPVVVIGVGAQTGRERDLASLAEVRPATSAFVSAVLERSATIGVRGEFTASFLADLGFGEDRVDVIGCPSLYLHGPGFQLTPARQELGPESRLALNVTDGVVGLGELVEALVEAWPSLVYVGQDRDDLRLLLWGEAPVPSRDPRLPFHQDHRLYREDRVRFPLDAWTWLDLLREMDFTVGTRLHGNVASLLADTPAMLLAHDSRTMELAELHALPHRPMDGLPAGITAEELHAGYDPGPFNRAYPGNFERYLGFLERNDLTHVYADEDGGTTFDERLAGVTFPPPVSTLHGSSSDQLAARLRWLRDGLGFDPILNPQAYQPPFPVPPARELTGPHAQQHDSTDRRIAKLERQLARTRERLADSRAKVRDQAALLRRLERRVERRLERHADRLDRQAGRLDALEESVAGLESSSAVQRLVRRVRGSDPG